MKFFFSILSLFYFTSSFYAQIEQGRSMLGLSGGFYNSGIGAGSVAQPNGRTYVQQEINASLRAGYLSGKHMMLGLNFSYSDLLLEYMDLSGSWFPTTQTSRTKLSSIGCFARFFKPFGEGRVVLFAHAGANYVFGSNVVSIRGGSPPMTDNFTSEITGFSGNLTPGIVFFVNKYIGIEATVGSFEYLRFIEADAIGSGSNTSSVWNFNYGLASTTLGVNFYFGGRPAPRP